MMNRRLMMAASMAIALMTGALVAGAQVPGFKRVELQRHDLSTKNVESVLARGELQPGAVVPRHTHPGEEVSYVLEGELLLEIDGQPATKLKAGDTFFIAAGLIHTVKNTGKGAAAILSTYILEKGKPLATMVK
jgi:quercetin dioxygenase-like cupin family protein